MSVFNPEICPLKQEPRDPVLAGAGLRELVFPGVLRLGSRNQLIADTEKVTFVCYRQHDRFTCTGACNGFGHDLPVPDARAEFTACM